MKKIIAPLIISVFLFSSAFAGIVSIPGNEEHAGMTAASVHIKQTFSTIGIEREKYANIVSDGCSFSHEASCPVMPYKSETMTFPFGTKIEGVDVEVGNVQTMQLDKKIMPAAEPVPSNMENVKVEIKEGMVYESNEPYPSNWVEWRTGAGIENGKHVIFLSIHAFPARYMPATNKLEYVNEMSIEVKYVPPEKPMLAKDVYDLLIVSPYEFSDALQPLVEHKESYGVKTMLVTLDEIYNGNYFEAYGRDDAEKVKYFIKDGIEQWGIDYVMLVGGRHGGVSTEKWWCPVRYSHLDDGSNWESSYLSDLYFADIYKYDNGNITFEDWDSNGNGIYAEWKMMKKDVIDMYPDVYVGRLACRNSFEVDTMVEKIITYETGTYGQSWFKKFVGVAGDTYPGDDDPYYEGELATEAAFNYLDGFEANYIWTSTGALSDADDIINAISEGCGFLHFSGHGNPISWANHPPQDGGTWIGIDVTQFMKLKNGGMYPVCIVGGCHNNQFNTSLANIIKGVLEDGLRYFSWKQPYGEFWYNEWFPRCWGWGMTVKIDGGSIATIANTGYGYGEPGENCLNVRGRYMELQFFKSYSEGKDVLGETHGSGLTYYLNKFPPMSDKVDSKIVQQWELLGDPSLKIGGY
jgi:hypothetical protein